MTQLRVKSAPELGVKKAEIFLKHLRTKRTPVVSKAMLTRVDRISKDKKKAVAFLKKGGFLDNSGKLSAKYRTQPR